MSLSENLGDSPFSEPQFASDWVEDSNMARKISQFDGDWESAKSLINPMVFPLSWKISIDGFPIYISIYIYTHNISRCYLLFPYIYIHMKLYEPWTSIYNSV